MKKKTKSMTNRNRCHWLRIVVNVSICLGMTLSSHNSRAAGTPKVLQLSEQTVEVGIKSQREHETWVEEEDRLLGEIEDMELLLSHIGWQRKKLAVYSDDLRVKISDLEQKAKAMEAVNMKLLPVLEAAQEKLEESLETDMPGNFSERHKSMYHSRSVLNDYDMGLLDKTRAVLDAAAREVDLGHQVFVTEDAIEVNGEQRRVKLLQVGRVGLYAMTLDSEKAYQWQGDGGGWLEIEKDITAIHDAIEIGEGIRLVALSRLPVIRPESNQLQEKTVQ